MFLSGEKGIRAMITMNWCFSCITNIIVNVGLVNVCMYGRAEQSQFPEITHTYKHISHKLVLNAIKTAAEKADFEWRKKCEN